VLGRRSSTDTGRIGETLAHRYLEASGFVIIEHNWRCPAGEIDIVARDGTDWVFVEVKARRSDRFGTPEDAITPAKQKRLLQCGLLYMAAHALEDANWRIDVVAIMLSRANEAEQIRIYANAVRASGTL